MWVVSIDVDKTPLNYKKHLDEVYGEGFFPRKLHYKGDAQVLYRLSRIITGATMKIEKV